MRNPKTILIFLVILTNLVACKSWKPASEYSYPVYSDDGLAVAAVQLQFLEKSKVTHMARKDFTVQVLVNEDMASSLTPLTDYRDGNISDLFYMGSQGYIILGRTTDWLGSETGGSDAEVWYEKIDLDGNITTIAGGTFPVALSCDGGQSSTTTSPPVRIIPSPDGETLVLFESETSCTERIQTVTFYDAAHLNIIGGPFDVPDLPPETIGDSPMWRTIDMGWTTEGEFATGYWGHGPDFDTYTASIFDPVNGLQPDQDLAINCFHPPTTSSSVDANGTMLNIDEDSGQVSTGGSEAPGLGGPMPVSEDPFNHRFGCAQ